MERKQQTTRGGVAFGVETENTSMNTCAILTGPLCECACFAWMKWCCPRMNGCEQKHAEPAAADDAHRVHGVSHGLPDAVRTEPADAGVLAAAAAVPGVAGEERRGGGMFAYGLVPRIRGRPFCAVGAELSTRARGRKRLEQVQKTDPSLSLVARSLLEVLVERRQDYPRLLAPMEDRPRLPTHLRTRR